MTSITAPTTTATAAPTTPITPVTFDLYRDVHKGIRSELFAVTEQAGRIDPSVRDDRVAVADHLRSLVAFLVSHAEHEDAEVQPSIEQHLPALAAQIAAEHEEIEARMVALTALAATAVDAGPATRRSDVHVLYLELASFTSAYLAHQDLEERLVMPALEAAIGVPAVVGIHGAIIGSLSPEEKVQGLSMMLPVMNVDDRTDVLGGMRETAPPEVFEGIWSLARSVLPAAESAAVAARLGL